ncbi:MAG: hypothetical protein KDH15_13960 [Rhodocyclaceae bacterium]|nr:hypothetical protein [Rhodocyclaceae bacterium]
MRILRVVVIAALLSNIPLADSQQGRSDEHRIESALLAADGLVEVRAVADVPPDVREAFTAVVPWDAMAERGVRWNSTDLIVPDQPYSQHIFSALAPSVAVVVFQIGGIAGPHTNIVVGQRAAPGFCIYRIGNVIPKDIEAVRALVRDKHPDRNGVPMACEYHAS